MRQIDGASLRDAQKITDNRVEPTRQCKAASPRGWDGKQNGEGAVQLTNWYEWDRILDEDEFRVEMLGWLPGQLDRGFKRTYAHPLEGFRCGGVTRRLARLPDPHHCTDHSDENEYHDQRCHQRLPLHLVPVRQFSDSPG
ncbi:hypothetical protein ACIRG5_00305 [Lentzea sp. NPDC102401]|uniref:hypothetical protein n=1 Tax=Lentzea sp. NPDC102401 TaxID=3364128 RepID=UPI0037FFF4B2